MADSALIDLGNALNRLALVERDNDVLARDLNKAKRREVFGTQWIWAPHDLFNVASTLEQLSVEIDDLTATASALDSNRTKWVLVAFELIVHQGVPEDELIAWAKNQKPQTPEQHEIARLLRSKSTPLPELEGAKARRVKRSRKKDRRGGKRLDAFNVKTVELQTGAFQGPTFQPNDIASWVQHVQLVMDPSFRAAIGAESNMVFAEPARLQLIQQKLDVRPGVPAAPNAIRAARANDQGAFEEAYNDVERLLGGAPLTDAGIQARLADLNKGDADTLLERVRDIIALREVISEANAEFDMFFGAV